MLGVIFILFIINILLGALNLHLYIKFGELVNLFAFTMCLITTFHAVYRFIRMS